MSTTTSTGSSAAAATDVRPFRVHFDEDDLVDLRRRIAATRWPEQETVADDSQGVPLVTMQSLAAYWACLPRGPPREPECREAGVILSHGHHAARMHADADDAEQFVLVLPIERRASHYVWPRCPKCSGSRRRRVRSERQRMPITLLGRELMLHFMAS